MPKYEKDLSKYPTNGASNTTITYNHDRREMLDYNYTGNYNTLNFPYNVVVSGKNNTINGNNSSIYGENNKINGDKNKIYADNCTINGNNNTIYSDNCIINGDNNTVEGKNCTINGKNNHLCNGSTHKTIGQGKNFMRSL